MQDISVYIIVTAALLYTLRAVWKMWPVAGKPAVSGCSSCAACQVRKTATTIKKI